VRRTALILATVAAVLAAHPWACFHGDPQHTGRSAVAVGAPLTLGNRYGMGGEVSGSPVVRDDGAVLVGARDVFLYCFAADLTLNWRADLTAYGTSIYFSAPALDDSGNAYVTTNRKLVKVSRDGAVLWAWPGHNSLSISHSPVVGLDGKVYFACYSDSLYALNPDSTPAWAADLGNSVNSAPAVGPDGRIYVATTRGTGNWKLWCFNPDGASPWSFELAADADFASPAVGPDTTIYVGANRYLYAIRPNGTLKWRDTVYARIQSCPAIANESTLYVVAGAYLYCVNADSGARWRRSIGGSNYCSPAVDAEGHVYVGSANGAASFLYCFGQHSNVLDSVALGDDVWSSPAIGPSGRVYVGNMDASFFMLQGPGAGIVDAGSAVGQGCWFLPSPVRASLQLPAGVSRIRLFDATGRLARAQQGGRVLNLGGLKPGLYLAELITDTGRKLEKVVLH